MIDEHPLNASSLNLPNDVFEPGEAKPMRPLKRPVANGTVPVLSKKRNAPTEVCRAMIETYLIYQPLPDNPRRPPVTYGELANI